MAHVKSYNHVTLVGRVGRIGELQIRKGRSAAQVYFSLATTERFHGENVNERTDWHNCSAWGAMAKFIDEHLSVGSLVALDGKLRAVVHYNEQHEVKSKSTLIEVGSLTVLQWKKPKDEGEDGEAPPRRANQGRTDEEPPPERRTKPETRRETPRDEDDFSGRLDREGGGDWPEPTGGNGPMDEDEIPF